MKATKLFGEGDLAMLIWNLSGPMKPPVEIEVRAVIKDEHEYDYVIYCPKYISQHKTGCWLVKENWLRKLPPKDAPSTWKEFEKLTGFKPKEICDAE